MVRVKDLVGHIAGCVPTKPSFVYSAADSTREPKAGIFCGATNGCYHGCECNSNRLRQVRFNSI